MYTNSYYFRLELSMETMPMHVCATVSVIVRHYRVDVHDAIVICRCGVFEIKLFIYIYFIVFE